jgi:predicted RNase H-like HicB family nuclease
MRYTVILEPTREAGQPGWYYAHIPALDLTTHGFGVEGALAAAKDLVEGWIAERRAQGEAIPDTAQDLVTQIEVCEDAIHAA